MPVLRRRPRRGTAPVFSIALAAAMGMLKAMKRMRPWLLALMLLALAPISEALAECTDPPAPGVNWRRCIFDRLEFKNADLTGAKLRDASFFRADLSGTNLAEADVFRAKFVNTVLTGASFRLADLREADMTKAHPPGANPAAPALRPPPLSRPTPP